MASFLRVSFESFESSLRIHGCDAEFSLNGSLVKLKNLFQEPCDMARRAGGCAPVPDPEPPARAQSKPAARPGCRAPRAGQLLRPDLTCERASGSKNGWAGVGGGVEPPFIISEASKQRQRKTHQRTEGSGSARTASGIADAIAASSADADLAAAAVDER